MNSDERPFLSRPNLAWFWAAIIFGTIVVPPDFSLVEPVHQWEFGLACQCMAQETAGTDVDEPPAVAAAQGINFLTLLTQGGWFMIPLVLLSLGVVTISIERFLALRKQKIFPYELVDVLSLLSDSPGGLEPRKTYEACQRYPSSAAYVLRSLLVKVGRPQSEMETAVSEASQREATRLSQMTSWLSLAAAVAPLIGLLGTVWGITQAFYDTTQLAELNAGQNRGVALASGIYVALVTTMVGLMIAIPSAILSHFYETRIISLMNQIEEMVFNLMPQFERYEGQVRFTQPTTAMTENQNEDSVSSSGLETVGPGATS
ncbi:MAG: MotA/TolQ/ExbB proton channel family protein [Planctomycetota bacterium]